MSTSYGEDEQTVPESFARRVCADFAQLGARGVTLVFSSGDGGVGAIGDPEAGHVATESDRFALTSSELVWRSAYNRIHKLGYELRERYNPKWIPSWRKAGYTDAWLEEHDFLWASFEDSISVRGNLFNLPFL